MRGRYCEKETAAFSWRALNPYPAPMKLHQPLRNCQSQARSFFYAVRCRRHLAEFLKNRGVLSFRYADTGIAHTKANLTIVRLSRYVHVAFRRREFHGVTQQVVKNLLEASAVAVSGQAGICFAAELDFFCFSERPRYGEGFRYGLGGRKVLV